MKDTHEHKSKQQNNTYPTTREKTKTAPTEKRNLHKSPKCLCTFGYRKRIAVLCRWIFLFSRVVGCCLLMGDRNWIGMPGHFLSDLGVLQAFRWKYTNFHLSGLDRHQIVVESLWIARKIELTQKLDRKQNVPDIENECWHIDDSIPFDWKTQLVTNMYNVIGYTKLTQKQNEFFFYRIIRVIYSIEIWMLN